MPNPPPPSSHPGEKNREEIPVSILLVDDDPKNLLALESILEGQGYRLVSALTAEEALLRLMHESYAAIVLDVQMPDLNGIELARLIKQRRKTQHIPILFLTAHYRESEDVVLGYDVGAVDYLTKPVNPAVLRSKISVFVDLFRKTHALAEMNRSMEEEILERQTAEERFRVVVEAAPSAMLVVTHDGQVSLVNSQTEQLFGQSREYLLGRNVTDLVPKVVQPDLDAVRDLAADAVNHLATAARETSLRLPDGQEVPAEVSFRPIKSREGVRWLVSIVDITERKRAEVALRTANAELEAKNRALLREGEERLRRIQAEAARAEAEAANAAKDRFLAMLSHELRTPLSPVLHAVTFLNDQLEAPPQLRETLQIIQRNVQLEARLIDDLLDLARVRNGKLELQLQTTDAHELLRNAIEICRPDTVARHLTLELSLKAKRTLLNADPARLQQIFWNLINNAVKFTPEGGCISVSTRTDEHGGFHLEITDTGIGIEKGKIPRIFDAFEQVTPGFSSGLGLGLAICKALTEFHGGKITAQSSGKGQGATFTVVLPTISNGQVNGQSEKPPVAPTAPVPLRLLVVEDHHDTADMLQRLLVRRGYKVRAANSVAGALEAANEFPFDVLVTDIGLPDGTGVELFQSLRQRRGESIRGVALSGFGMDEDIARSKEAGFSNHITKPVDFSVLQRCLSEIGQSMERE